jgi:hypothetical protein
LWCRASIKDGMRGSGDKSGSALDRKKRAREPTGPFSSLDAIRSGADEAIHDESASQKQYRNAGPKEHYWHRTSLVAVPIRTNVTVTGRFLGSTWSLAKLRALQRPRRWEAARHHETKRSAKLNSTRKARIAATPMSM